MKFEFDLDGVLCDIHSALEKRIQALGYKDYRADNIKRYDMKNSGIGCPRAVLMQNLYSPQIYDEAQPMQYAVDLVSWILKNGHEVVINTLCTQEQSKKKLEWIGNFQSKIDGGTCLVLLNKDYGVKQMTQDADVCIEDCIDNIRRSPASTKILLKAPYNRLENNRDSMDVFEEAIYADDLLMVKKELVKLFPKEFTLE